jgi:hypothetical protein
MTRSTVRSTSPAPPSTTVGPRGSLLASALWDDTWTDIGGTAALITALRRNPLVNARRVGPDDDALPPGLTRDLPPASDWALLPPPPGTRAGQGSPGFLPSRRETRIITAKRAVAQVVSTAIG